jgi:NAD+ synthase
MKTEKIITHIVDWITNYMHNNPVRGIVVGVSGGIDSAVTSALCAESGYPLTVVTLPINQREKQKNLALSHVDWLIDKYGENSVEHIDLDLTHSYETLFSDIKNEIVKVPSLDKRLLTLANMSSRLRMTTLYSIASLKDYLVCGTGNKIEDFGVGFFTKYGDGGVDISPIADLYKSEVYEIGKKLSIDKNIITAKPMDGLWEDGRTDEDQIGATYDELEYAMHFVNGDPEFVSKPLTDRMRKVIAIYAEWNHKNKHKMEPVPVCKIDEYLRK